MRHCLDLALLALGFCACSDATGALQGGQPQPLPTIAGTGSAASGSSGGGTGSSGSAQPAATWTYLYNAYFGNSATGGCGSSKIICHQSPTDSGATVGPVNDAGQPVPPSGFVCGTTAAACYEGMTKTATPPLVSASDAANPTMALLYRALYTGGNAGSASDNMPETQLYYFHPSDLALIAQWIQDGAKNN